MTTIAITETMEQVRKHIEKYLALHREISDDRDVLVGAIKERWGDVPPAEILEQAEVNSLAMLRLKLINSTRSNPLVDTTVQCDLFFKEVLSVPSYFMIDGEQRSYAGSLLAYGYEWWSARKSAKKDQKDAHQEAANNCAKDEAIATLELEKLERIMIEAQANGIDPSTLTYAKAPE